LPGDVLLNGVTTRVQLLRITAPLKFSRAKNFQNWVRFTTTFEFEHKYFWKRWR